MSIENKMNNIIENRFDISGDDIALLGDTDLRELIGRLCEADCRVSNISPTSVTYGGHQDAGDGGIDVAVAASQSFSTKVAVPCCNTGFQVKKSSMPKSAILSEMKPKGTLRPSIQKLIDNDGAYIIVSSGDSVTDSSLKERINAMKEVTTESFHVDFYDRKRVATWVRLHPSLILWVREKIGRPFAGWKPYGNWANAGGGVDEEYLIDDGLCLQDDTKNQEPNISIQEGLNRIRQRLSAPKSSIRLVGLSGVGKTRLAQALFDNRLGENALPKDFVLYTDMSDSPNPSPEHLAEQLINESSNALIIIDNCPPELHKKLSFRCTDQKSHLSLLTVEYDVRNEELSDETNVFHLEPSSDELIKKLILKRFTHISQVDAATIAEASGGNYRIAIALGNTVRKGDNITGLTDIQLFKRLFEQQQGSNDDLMLSASLLSLVYSFNGEDVLSEESELKLLSSLINKSPSDVYKDIAELQRRNLIQSRSVWRAVLPHAIANMLAKYALESIPKEILINTIIYKGSERLIRSFSKRLGYLHNVPQAISVVQQLLSKDGWIGDVSNLSKFGIDVFENFASTALEEALEAIERASSNNKTKQFLTRENPNFLNFVRILRFIAYEKKYFKRCVNLICEIAITENENENNNSTRAILKSLFTAYLSGTLAEDNERLEVIEDFLQSSDDKKQAIGLMLLGASLEAWHFTSCYSFSFGGRKRDYGYCPRGEQVTKWYTTFISATEKIALSNDRMPDRARKILADSFRGLWTSAHMFDALEKLAVNLHKKQPWNDGWIAIRETLRYDKDRRAPEITERLKTLEQKLSPDNLEEKCRAYVLSGRHLLSGLDDLDDEEDTSSRINRIEEIIFNLGLQFENDKESFQNILSELTIQRRDSDRLHMLGNALAQTNKKREFWAVLKEQLYKTEQEKRNPKILIGMIFGVGRNDIELANVWLDEVLQDIILGCWFPSFQTQIPIDQKGLERLHAALDKNISPIWLYEYIAYGRTHEVIEDNDLAILIRKIISKENGRYIALEILNMRFHRTEEHQYIPEECLLEIARELLSTHTFTDRSHRADTDYNLSQIAKVCLKGNGGAETASEVSRNLLTQLSSFKVYSHDYTQLLNSIAETQPQAFLDIFLGNETENIHEYRIFSHDFERDRNPLDFISDKDIIFWCEKCPEKRYPIIASTVKTFDDYGTQWRSITYIIFENAPDLEPVLTAIAENIRPSGWMGSLANILQGRIALFPKLFDYQDSRISNWARKIYDDLQSSIPKLRNKEMETNRERDQRFEW